MKLDLIYGDCLEKMQAIASGSVDLILTDPPYGTTACKWDSVIPLEMMWQQLKRVIKINGAIVLFGSEPFSSALRMSNIEQYKYDWIWDKVTAKGHLVAKIRPMQQTEIISVFGCNKINYHPIMKLRDKPRFGGKEYGRTSIVGGRTNEQKNINKTYTHCFPRTLITFSNASNKDRLHPTQKPVALMEYLIKTYTNEGETVLDFTMGSGTTGVACKKTNRNFIGIEKDDKYFKIAQDRIAQPQQIALVA
jgi:site-specific DNA-methyltransferase (adenine-specific)